MSVTRAQIWNLYLYSRSYIFQSCNFQYRIFSPAFSGPPFSTPAFLVFYFPVLHFSVLHFQSHIFQYCIFGTSNLTSLVSHFPVLHFPVPHFPRPQINQISVNLNLQITPTNIAQYQYLLPLRRFMCNTRLCKFRLACYSQLGLSVALFVCFHHRGHRSTVIFTKLYTQVGRHRSGENWLNFGGNPHQIRIQDYSVTDFSRLRDTAFCNSLCFQRHASFTSRTLPLLHPNLPLSPIRTFEVKISAFCKL